MQNKPPDKLSKFFLRVERKYFKLTGRKFVHFIHIGKTGGTAIKYALTPYLKTCKYFINLHSHSFRLRDAPAGESVFFFLRDPVSRFTSGFYSRQRQGQPRMFFPWSPEEKVAFDHFTTPNQLASALSSLDPDHKKLAIDAMNSISHVRNHYWEWFVDEAYFLSRAKDIFFVGFQESLDQDFEVLRRKFYLPVAAGLPVDEVHSHRNPSGADKRLEPESIQNLKQWYQQDYDFIDFCRKFIDENKLNS